MSVLPEGRESQFEIEELPIEAKRLLPFLGYNTFAELKGHSIASLRAIGKSFYADWDNKFPEFQNLASRRMQVAFNPDRPFLPDSNCKTLDQQLLMVQRANQQLSHIVPGVEMVILETPEYAELLHDYFEKTGERLFKTAHHCDYIRSVTMIDSDNINLGFHAETGVDLFRWLPGGTDPYLWAFPVIIPAKGEEKVDFVKIQEERNKVFAI